MPQELKSYSSNAKIFCPYFKEQHRCSIKCDGMFDKQLSTILTFQTSNDKKVHINNFCIGTKCYLGCPVAIAINENFEIKKDDKYIEKQT